MLSLKNIHKSFGSLHVLRGIDLNVKEGEIVCILGSSGSGKSTLLRAINFLDPADSGFYQFKDFSHDISNVAINQQVDLRKQIGMVFQNHSLFDHYTVTQNITKPLKIVHRKSQAAALQLAMESLEQVGLTVKANVYPSQLSGGQQQRVGIARAIANKPSLVLFDEPTSALDPELVQEVLSVIKTLSQTNMTMLIVTHEVQFALKLADRILFMEDGLIIADQTPEEIEKKPHPRFAAFVQSLEN